MAGCGWASPSLFVFTPTPGQAFGSSARGPAAWPSWIRPRVIAAAGRVPDLPDGGGGGGSREEPGLSLPRREVIMRSVLWAVLGEVAIETDAQTVVNSILGAYGLPQLVPASPGFKYYDDLDSDFVFEFPKSWVGRQNRQRPGLYFANFQTADKCQVEVFSLDPDSSGSSSGGGSEARVPRVAAAAVAKLINPGGTVDPEVGGDARLELPSSSQIKTSTAEIDGQTYVYLAFPSNTTTRSGYDVKRKNYAVAAVKGGQAYVLGASARRDQFNPEKEELLKRIVSSFRLR